MDEDVADDEVGNGERDNVSDLYTVSRAGVYAPSLDNVGVVLGTTAARHTVAGLKITGTIDKYRRMRSKSLRGRIYLSNSEHR